MTMPFGQRVFNAPPLVLPALRRPPTRPHVPFYKLPTHNLPTRWSLYRSLLRHAPDSLHREAIKSRWRRPRKRHCTSPHLTLRLLLAEQQTLKDYIELSNLIQCASESASRHSPASQVDGGFVGLEKSDPASNSGASASAVETEVTDKRQCSQVPYYMLPGLQTATAERLRGLEGHLAKLLLEKNTSIALIEEYVSIPASGSRFTRKRR